MRKTILMTALIGATLAAVPAAAQSYGYDRGYGYGNNDRGYGENYRNGASQELWRLSQRVDQGVRTGDLNRREADYFRREIQQLRWLDQRYGRGGYSGSEQRQLDQRIDRLRQRLRFERRDDDRRGDWRRDDDRRW